MRTEPGRKLEYADFGCGYMQGYMALFVLDSSWQSMQSLHRMPPRPADPNAEVIQVYSGALCSTSSAPVLPDRRVSHPCAS